MLDRSKMGPIAGNIPSNIEESIVQAVDNLEKAIQAATKPPSVPLPEAPAVSPEVPAAPPVPE
jgi:hypothetical protein